jgi:pentatricopeptide repeat protein
VLACHNVGVTLASGLPTRVQLCGPLVVERGEDRLDGRLPGRQGRLLFAFLAVNRHRVADRAELVEAVWPGSGPSSTESALNALLSKLRSTLGEQALPRRSSVRLDLGSAWVDVDAAIAAAHRAESAVALGDWARAWAPALVAMFVSEREFLPGEDFVWVDEHRRQLAEVRLRALDCYAAAGLGLGGTELAAADRAARQLVRLAPLRESGYRHLMRALASQGNIAEALRVYGELCDLLREELGAVPSPTTREVYEQLVAT